MKTIRRDKLLKLARAGKLVAVHSYHFDDMTGSSGIERELPVRVQSGYGDFQEGFCNLRESDFDSCCGRAYENGQGIITLIVHSNCNYDFRLVDGGTVSPVKPARGQRPENKRMQAFLESHGITVTARYLATGSMRGCWQLYNSAVRWSLDLAGKLNGLGFTDFDGGPLGEFSGNGGSFSVAVRGHNELLNS